MDELDASDGFPRRTWLPHPAWLVMGAVMVGMLAAGFAYFYPFHRTQGLIAEIHRLGGNVRVHSEQPAWMRQYLPQELFPAMLALEVADLRSVPTDDQLASRLGRERWLTFIILSGPELTDQGLTALCAGPRLKRIVLINCPRITSSTVQNLRKAQPGRVIGLRGPAMLGINGVDESGGCRLNHVEPGSAAELAGLQLADVVTRFDDRPVTGFESLCDLIAVHKPGDTVTLDYLRGTEPRQARPFLQPWSVTPRPPVRIR